MFVITFLTRLPVEVTKSTLSGNARLSSLVTMRTRWACRAISEAPPEPGRRTLGLPYGPTTVVLMLPCLSTCAPPRKPTWILPF